LFVIYRNYEMLFTSLPRLRETAFMHALKMEALPGGMVVECGVHDGKSVNLLARAFPDRQVHGFDSFRGLPEDWEMGYSRGHFDRGGAFPDVRENVVLTAGWFEDTLPEFARTAVAAGRFLAFLHVDCDLYSSTKTVLDTMRPLLRAGTIIVFDELINYPNYQNHEWKAMSEFLERTRVAVRWIGNYRGVFDRDPDPGRGLPPGGSCKVACVVVDPGADN
jgi:predicted O-methyltransferase YrrM